MNNIKIWYIKKDETVYRCPYCNTEHMDCTGNEITNRIVNCGNPNCSNPDGNKEFKLEVID